MNHIPKPELKMIYDKETGIKQYFFEGTLCTHEEYHQALKKYYSKENEYIEESEYRYKDFNEYFKNAAPLLWNVQKWDNEMIKRWLQDAFHCSRLSK
jgi:uncharacterized membrane protein YgaE (UPF0421/DUF939 family)